MRVIVQSPPARVIAHIPNGPVVAGTAYLTVSVYESAEDAGLNESGRPVGWQLGNWRRRHPPGVPFTIPPPEIFEGFPDVVIPSELLDVLPDTWRLGIKWYWTRT